MANAQSDDIKYITTAASSYSYYEVEQGKLSSSNSYSADICFT